MVRFIVRTLISGAAVFAVSYFSGGTLIEVKGLLAGVVFALVLGVVNGVLRPVVQMIALPLSILTLGVAALFVNLGMFYLAAALTPGVVLTGFWQTVLASIVIAFFNSIAAWMTERGDR